MALALQPKEMVQAFKARFVKMISSRLLSCPFTETSVSSLTMTDFLPSESDFKQIFSKAIDAHVARLYRSPKLYLMIDSIASDNRIANMPPSKLCVKHMYHLMVFNKHYPLICMLKVNDKRGFSLKESSDYIICNRNGNEESVSADVYLQRAIGEVEEHVDERMKQLRRWRNAASPVPTRAVRGGVLSSSLHVDLQSFFPFSSSPVFEATPPTRLREAAYT